MTAPSTEPTDPAISGTELAALSSLMQALSAGSSVAELVGILASLPGISGEAVRALFELSPVFRTRVRSLPEPPPASPDSVRNTARTNLIRRAQYLANAARRISSAGDLGKAVDAEKQHFRAHLQAVEKRRVAAQTVAKAEDRYGPLLGWYSQRDDRTTQDCWDLHGSNFYSYRPPREGYPGTVHVHCRCVPGRPHLDARGRPKPPRDRYAPDGGAGFGPGPGGAGEVAAVNRYPKDTQLVELARESGSLQATATQVGVSRVSLTNYLLRRPQLDAAVRAVLNSAARVDLADDHKSSIHPDPPNRPGKNWIEKIGGHLPSFIKRVAKHIMSDSGYTQSRAIAAAISQCKKGRLGPKGLAAAAQWEALKARAHAHSNTAYRACQVIELGHEVVDHFRVIELATLTAQQQAEYYGTARTGTKAKAKPASTSGGKKKVVRTEAGARRYKVPIGSEIGAARDKNAAAAQQNAAARGNYEKAVGAKDRDAQVAALNPKDLGDLSRIAFSFRSSDPNVVALRMTAVRELTKRGMDPKQFGYLGGGSAKPTAKVVAKAPARKPTVKKPAPAAKKPIPKDPKAVGPHKSSPGQVRVR